MIQRMTKRRITEDAMRRPSAVATCVSQNPLAKLPYTSNCVLEPKTTLPVPKTPKTASPTDETPVTPEPPTAAASASPAPPKKRAKSGKTPATKASAGKKAAARKTSAKKKGTGGAAKKAPMNKPQPSASEAAEPSDADIRLRAYFIAERRVQLALQGDPARDWIEARQQLIEEARKAHS
jgi:hypothetical protein